MRILTFHSLGGDPALKTWRVLGAEIRINLDGLGIDCDSRFHAVTLKRKPTWLTLAFLLGVHEVLSLWIKSYDVTIFIIISLQQYFHVVLCIQYVVGVVIQVEPLQQYFRLVLFY